MKKIISNLAFLTCIIGLVCIIPMAGCRSEKPVVDAAETTDKPSASIDTTETPTLQPKKTGIIVDTFALGDLKANCYCVRQNKDARDCLIIDPGMKAEPLVQMLKENGYTPVAIFLTHGHFDHIDGVNMIREHWPKVRVAIHKDDAGMLPSPEDNLAIMFRTYVKVQPADILLDDDDKYYEAAGLRFQLLHTPGHSPGSICLYSPDDQIIFAGDVLFAGSIGRWDFPGGNKKILLEMINQKLLTLPDETKVYSGHYSPTTIGVEKKTNRYLK